MSVMTENTLAGSGADLRNRTADILLTRQALYLLS